MHRSIKQHMVRNAKFTCFSKKKKKKKTHTTTTTNPKNPKTKQNTNKTLGLTTKEIVLEFEQGVPPPQTYSYFCSLGSFIGEKKSIKKIQQNCFTMIKMN